MTFEETLNEIKEVLKNSVTAENAEKVASLDKKLDVLHDAHKSTIEENTKLKDRIVEIVQNTGFKQTQDHQENPSKNDPKNQQELFDDVFGDLINKK